MPQDFAVFRFACKAHSAAHIMMRVGGCNAVGGSKVKQGVELYFTGVRKQIDYLAIKIFRPSF